MAAGQSSSTDEDERFRESAFRAMSDAQLSAWLQANPVFEDLVVRDRASRAELLAYRKRFAQARPPALARLLGDDATVDEGPATPASDGLRALARLASSSEGMNAIVSGFDVATLGVVRLAIWLGGRIGEPASAQRMLDGLTEAEITASAKRTQESLLGRVGHGPWLLMRDDVAENIGALGVSMRTMEAFTSDELGSILAAHDVKRPSTKAERLTTLGAVLRDRAVVEREVTSMSRASQALFWRLVERVEPMSFEESGARYFAAFGSTQRLRPTGSELEPLARLGLVHGDNRAGFIWTWRELIQAFPERVRSTVFMPNGPRPVRGATPLTGDSSRIPPVVDDADRVLAAWRREPPPALNDGGLGVAPVRALAKKLGLPAAHVGVITNFVVRRELLQRAVAGYEGRGRLRRPKYEWKAAADPAWQATSPVDQWSAMVTWWMGETAISEWNGAPERLSFETSSADTRLARKLFLRLLFDAESGTGFEEEDLARTLWRRYPSVFGPVLVDGVIGVVRALGLVPRTGPVGLTTATRSLFALRLEDLAVSAETSFVVQGDHTIIAPLNLDRQLGARLANLADVESEGGAKVMRITEASIARAFDHGESALDIEALLRTHSTKDVPQSLVYLVHDVERRRSRLSIVNAASVATIIVSDDAALVAQAVRVAAAKLEAVGAHAATSALTPARVEAALAAKGVLGVVVSGRAAAAPAKGAGSKVGAGSADSPAATAAAALAAGRSTRAPAALLRAAAEHIDGTAAAALARALRNPEA